MDPETRVQMDPFAERPSPDMRPWDQETAQRVQPVLSALFHDIMSPLTLLKSRLYLVRQQLVSIARDPQVPADIQQRLGSLVNLLDGIEDAGDRIHRGMTIPRDAIWATLLEGVPLDPAKIVEQIAEAMRSPEEKSEHKDEDSTTVSGTA
jgi:hypothetical protein